MSGRTLHAVKQQYCWTVLPQGFKNSPTIFGETLAKDLKEVHLEEGALHQYVDGILIVSLTKEVFDKNAITALNHLAHKGSKVSKKKAQISQTWVTYLGFILTEGQRSLPQKREEAICSLTPPKIRRQLRGFLGLARFCHIWIPNYGIIARPLYEKLKRKDDDPFEWNSECKGAFRELKKQLFQAPALALPDLAKPFDLYIHERRGIAHGILAQKLGPLNLGGVYFSKQLA